MTGAVFVTVPTAQAVTAPAADCRLASTLHHLGDLEHCCKDSRSDTSDDRDRTGNVGGLVGVVLDILFD
ncbi:hypothetical protein J8N05_19515 [Streptomyces sp. BH-SS-21]|uniref:Uncharacterized protein n=1 Tax=Streptomyces liliiviolaceus TaxID=2823109 RepID=A0A941B9S4_9ACTN|nr:hypothetical protein [Streptomyces liliiviolaceus]MBQ0850378.1 hypothetical protein [Streptomyces liliiviolaceus]